MNVWESLSRFAAALANAFAPRSVTPTGYRDATRLGIGLHGFEEIFRLTRDRGERYRDFEEMDAGDVAAVLSALTEAALSYEDDAESETEMGRPMSFRVICEGYATAPKRAVIEQVLRDTHLKDRVQQYGREMLKYGDVFTELLLLPEGDLVGLQSYAPSSIVVGCDAHGQPLGADREGRPQAFQQRDETGRVLAAWDRYEVVHWKYVESDREVYAERSFLDDIRHDWRKLKWIEESLVIARLTRAYPRLLHWLDATGKTDKEATKLVTDYVRALTAKNVGGRPVKTPMTVDEDYFRTTGYTSGGDSRPYPRLDKVEMLDPRVSGLSEIADVSYLRSKLHCRTPADLVGIPQPATVDISAQELAMAKMIRHLQGQIATGVRQILDTALVLKGLTPGGYFLEFPQPVASSNWKHADALFRTALAQRVWLEMNETSLEEIGRQYFNRTAEDMEKIFAEREKELVRFGPLSTPNGQVVGGNTSA